MAKKPTISTISSGYASNTQLNNNFSALRTGFDNTLSLDGSTPNAMNADLDMNGNNILNASQVNVDSLYIDGISVVPGDVTLQTTYLTASYTGDGSQVAYALTADPQTEANTSVYVDGVYQNKDTYSVSGVVVTFSEAPPLNSAIEIVYPTNTDTLNGTTADLITYNQKGTGAQDRTLTSKLQESVSVKDFGAVGDGVADDAAAILAAFKYIKSIGGGSIDFPFGTYLISHGFRVPSNTVVNFNGSTIKATTTFGQSIPSDTEAAGSFFALGRPNSESPLPSDIGNITFNGDGAFFDGRRDEQTGTVAGYSMIVMETTDTPVQVDNLKLKNIIIRDIEMDRTGYDGIYIAGVDGLYIENVTIRHALRIGFVGISGENVTFNNCRAINTVGDNASVPTSYRGPSNSGDGFWNEPNNDWQNMNKWFYQNCRAIANYRSGFKVWNAGPDAQYSIQLDNCYSYSNVFDETTSTLRSSPGEANYILNTNNTSASQAMVTFNNCVSEAANGSGFIITPNGGGASQRFVMNDLVAINCNQNDTASVNRTPIRVGATTYTATPTVIINNPLIVAPVGNSNGYGIYTGSMKNIYVGNPKFIGTFTQGLVVDTANKPSDSERGEAIFEVGNGGPDLGDVYKFANPVRPALFDQTSSPTVSTDLFRNEIALWQDDNNQIAGIYRRDDSTTPKYLDFNPKKRLRGVKDLTSASASIPAQDKETGTITVTGAALGDIVSIAATVNLDSDLILTARVSAADTVTYYVHNPSSGSTTRAATYLTVNVFGSDY